MTTRPTLPASLTPWTLETGANWDSHGLQAGNWAQEVLLGTNGTDQVAATACDYLPQHAQNLLTNGGFETYQRGTSFDGGGGGVAVADGWRVINATGSKETTTVDGSPASLKVVSHSGQGGTVDQTILECERLRGQVVSFWGRVNGCAGSIFIQDGTNTWSSATIDATSGWQSFRLTTGALAAATVSLDVSFVPTLVTQTYYVDNWMLTATPGPIAFRPLPPAIEWARMMRRYAIFPNVGLRFRSQGAGETQWLAVTFATPMFGSPLTSLSLSGATQSNVTSATVLSADVDSAIVQVVANLTGTDTYIQHATLTVDAGVY